MHHLASRLCWIILALTAAAAAQADNVTGVIRILHTNRAHVQLVGAITLNGGSCSSYWAANSLDEEKS